MKRSRGDGLEAAALESSCLPLYTLPQIRTHERKSKKKDRASRSPKREIDKAESIFSFSQKGSTLSLYSNTNPLSRILENESKANEMNTKILK